MIKIYEIPQESLNKIKVILEAQEKQSEEGTWQLNEFKRNGYTLRDASSLGIDKDSSYLYLKSSPEFFEKNEKILVDNGAKPLEGEEFEEVKLM